MFQGLELWTEARSCCAGDSRGKTPLPTVKKLNHTYTFENEDVSLTHVGIGQCRVACGIKDKDRFSKVRSACMFRIA